MAVKMPAIPGVLGADETDLSDLVRQELNRLCEDELFRDTTRVKRFLRYVTEETLQGRGDRLKGYTLGLEVFDRPEDFDPQSDTIVRVQAGQLRRRLELYYAGRGADNTVRISIPRGRYTPVFQVDENPAPRENTKMAVAKNAGNVITKPALVKDPRPVIAVMPLENLTNNENDAEYFADGLTAEITNALVQFRSMCIVSLPATVLANDRALSVQAIGEASGADAVVVGSVRQEAGIFRVNISLVCCMTGEHLFSRILDRKYVPGQIFTLQEEIASHVSAAVAAPLGALNRCLRRKIDWETASSDPYEAVLRYYDISMSPTRNEAKSLLKLSERLTEENPDFSSGWAVRSLLNILVLSQCFPVPNQKSHLKEAELCARKALACDGQNAFGYFALYKTYYHAGEFEDANRMIRRALALNPNDYSILAGHAVCLALRGDDQGALAIQASAIELVGRVPPWYFSPQMIVDFRHGNYESIVSYIESDPVDMPAAFQAYCLSALVLMGRVDDALAMLAKLETDYPNYMRELTLAVRQWHVSDDIQAKFVKSAKIAGLDTDALPHL